MDSVNRRYFGRASQVLDQRSSFGPVSYSLNEIERGLEVTKKCQDFREMRVVFDSVYNGKGMAYFAAYANEVVTKAVCVFAMCKGNLKQANDFGREHGTGYGLPLGDRLGHDKRFEDDGYCCGRSGRQDIFGERRSIFRSSH